MSAEQPNHPSRPCSGAMHVDGDWCRICGWPTTHTEPAAEIRGVFSAGVEVPRPASFAVWTTDEQGRLLIDGELA